jgi:hypothetical protein
MSALARFADSSRTSREVREFDVGYDRQLAKSGDDFAQEFDSLASKIGCLVCQAGGVAARPRETGDQALGNRISRDRENDRNGRCRLLRRNDCRGSLRDNDVDLYVGKRAL